jgi:6-bladed beta-propeller protein
MKMQRPRARFLVVALVLAAGGACGEAENVPEMPQAVVRDSAGVTIVENDRPAVGSRMSWTVGVTPALSIGTLEGEEAYQLYRVTDAIRLDDGRVIVVNRGSNELRVFDEAGTHVASWGSEGEGPGEFTGVIEARVWAGDSIMAWDFSQRRLSIFDLDGNLGRTFSVKQSEELSNPEFRELMPDGRLLVRASAVFTSGQVLNGLMRPDRPYAFMTVDGEPDGSFQTYAGRETYISASETSVSVYVHPFTRNAVSTIWNDLVVVTVTDSYEIRAYTPDGALARILRRDHAYRPQTQDDLDRHWDERFADDDPETRANNLTAVEGIPALESFPAFGRMLSDPLGYLWVEEYHLPNEERSIWTVFNREGHVQGFVETPPGLDVLEIGEDYILGETTDDFDIEYVQMWSLQRD